MLSVSFVNCLLSAIIFLSVKCLCKARERSKEREEQGMEEQMTGGKGKGEKARWGVV